MPKYLYFMGSDGSGKTTYIKELSQILNQKGLSVHYYWIRSPKILSKPLMLYCRLAGYTRYYYVDGVRYGSHDFHKSRFVAYLYPVLQLIDFGIRYLFDLRSLESVECDYIIFDRHAFDTLVDIMVDTKRLDLHKGIIGRAFKALVPKDVTILPFYVDPNVIRSRKVDTLHDGNLDLKTQVYRTLYKSMQLKMIDNSLDDMDKVLRRVEKIIGLRE